MVGATLSTTPPGVADSRMTMRRTRCRRGAQISALLVVAALLSACQARLAVDISVSAQGGGQLAVTLGADPELLRLAEEAGADPLDALLAAGDDLEAEGWAALEATTPDGGREVRLSAEFDDPDEFNALAQALVDALAAPEVRLLDELRLEVTDEELTVAGHASLRPEPAVTEFGLQPDEAVRLLAERDAFAYQVRVVLPGTLLRTTADDAEMPLRWSIPPGEDVEILAVTEAPGTPWWVAALAAAGIAVVLALGWLLLWRSRAR